MKRYGWGVLSPAISFPLSKIIMKFGEIYNILEKPENSRLYDIPVSHEDIEEAKYRANNIINVLKFPNKNKWETLKGKEPQFWLKQEQKHIDAYYLIRTRNYNCKLWVLLLPPVLDMCFLLDLRLSAEDDLDLFWLSLL